MSTKVAPAGTISITTGTVFTVQCSGLAFCCSMLNEQHDTLPHARIAAQAHNKFAHKRQAAIILSANR